MEDWADKKVLLIYKSSLLFLQDDRFCKKVLELMLSYTYHLLPITYCLLPITYYRGSFVIPVPYPSPDRSGYPTA